MNFGTLSLTIDTSLFKNYNKNSIRQILREKLSSFAIVIELFFCTISNFIGINYLVFWLFNKKTK